ncbi:F-box/LRR-repeat protein 15 [Chamberlinius hualienensis]
MDDTLKESQEYPRNYVVNLLDLPFEDIIHRNILIHLSLKDLFNFGQVSKDCHGIFETCLSKTRTIDLSSKNRKISKQAFQLIAKLVDHIEVLLFSDCEWLTDEVLHPLLESNSNINHISLAGCQNLTERSVQLLAQRNSYCLKIVDLCECQWINSESVETLALNCPNIISADFTGCCLINDHAVESLAKSCTRLKAISLSNIYGITDLSLFAIANNCRHLVFLDLMGCYRITDDGIRMIGEYCKEFKSLRVLQCRDVTESSLNSLRSHQVDIDLPRRFYPVPVLGLNLQI